MAGFFFVLKSLLGIARQWSCEKLSILSPKPRSHVRILIYRTRAIDLCHAAAILSQEILKALFMHG